MEDFEIRLEGVSPDQETAPPEETGQQAREAVAMPEPGTEGMPVETVSADDLLDGGPTTPADLPQEDAQVRAVLEAVVYVTEEPLTPDQIAAALQLPVERVQQLLDQLVAEFDKPEHGVTLREVAGGYKMATKAEHHEAVRNFVKSLKPPLKLSLAALETLAVIAYKQPVTSPEVLEIRGVQGGGVMKTLLDRKLIAVAGRKNVIGKPILYKTTREFLVQFGLKDLSELPSLKEFEEIRRMALSDEPQAPAVEAPGEAAEAPVVELAPAEPQAEEAAAADAGDIRRMALSDEPQAPAAEAPGEEPASAEPQAEATTLSDERQAPAPGAVASGTGAAGDGAASGAPPPADAETAVEKPAVGTPDPAREGREE